MSARANVGRIEAAISASRPDSDHIFSPALTKPGPRWCNGCWAWSISNGTCATSDDTVRVTIYSTPLTVDAGLDQSLCNTNSVAMAGKIGQYAQRTDALVENMKALLDAVNKSRPTGIKGIYLKKVSVSSTMGVGVRVDQGTMQV